ncbi:MAG: ankyrin repeat domain-containing protein [Geobacteraceae bacterium]|nr:ankyrin repeat domain-containing protein [Geobacteraceae bacterium]
MLRFISLVSIVFTLSLCCSGSWGMSQEELSEEFFAALAEGKTQEVAKAINKGFDVNSVNSENQTLLMKGARHGYKDIVELLLKNKANIAARDISGTTALMHAAKGGSLEVIKLLLAHGAVVDEADSSGETALMYACRDGNIDVVRLLLDSGANIEVRNKQGNTPLLISNRNRPVLELLIARGANREAVNNEGSNLLIRAVWNQSKTDEKEFERLLGDLKYIITQTKDIEHRDKKGNTALQTTVSDEILELLIKSGANVNARNYRGETALMTAAHGNYFKSVKILVKHGADLLLTDNDGHTAFWYAENCFMDGYCDQMKKLLRELVATVKEKKSPGADAEFTCGQIVPDVALPLPGQQRSLLLLAGKFSNLQVLLKTGDSCRVVLSATIDDSELNKRVWLVTGPNASFPDLHFIETRYSSTEGSKELSRIYVWNGKRYERKGLKEAAELNRQALVQLSGGSLAKAIFLLNQAYDLVGTANVEMVNNLGFAYYKQWLKSKEKKNYDDAERYLSEAAHLDNKRWQARLNLADLYSQAGRSEEALEQYAKAMELNPGETNVAKIRKKMDAMQKRADKPEFITEIRDSVGKGLSVYSFKLYGNKARKIVKRIVITDTSTKKVVQDLSVAEDYEEMASPPDDDYFALTDINFDGYRDISLLVGWGVTGHRDSSFWLFNPKIGKFAHNKDYDNLGTFSLDEKNKQINTHSNGGHAGAIYSDATYEVRGNKPVLIREINQDYDDKKGYYVEVTQELVDGQMKETGRKIVPGR